MIWFKNQPIGFCESDGELSYSVVLKLVTKHRWPMWYVGQISGFFQNCKAFNDSCC